jgi:hypothetical protein
MQAAVVEVDGVPPQHHDLSGAQAVAIGDQHHGGVAVAVAVISGSANQPVDLGVGQIFAAVARRGHTTFSESVLPREK